MALAPTAEPVAEALETKTPAIDDDESDPDDQGQDVNEDPR
jgi:hypothetical protein